MLEKIEWNDAGFIAILQGEEVRADLLARAEQIKTAAAVGDYTIHTDLTKTRVRISVGTGNYAARHAEATQRTLTRSLDAGRG